MSKDILYAEELSVSFDGFKALDVNHFELIEGELRVIIGPNGAGKTTFMDVICGKTKPDTGRVIMNGENLVKMKEKQIVDAGVGRKFQKPSIFPSLTVYENFMLAIRMNRSVWKSLFYKTNKAHNARIQEVARFVGLSDSMEKTAAYLSHGQKQWLEIGIVLIQDPKLLLIDEPAAGMTDEETHKTGELLMSLAGTHTIIVIEHDMEFVRQIAKTVTVLSE